MDLDTPTAAGGAAAAVSASILAFLKWLLPFVKRWRRETLANKTRESIIKVQKVYNALQAIEDAGVPRAIVFCGHNSGGYPRPGSPFYVSALHWHVSPAPGTVKGPSYYPELYQHLPIDKSYVNLLVELLENGIAQFKPEDHDRCQLKDIYKAEGLSDSLLVFLGVEGKSFYFLSAASYDGELTPAQITEIKLQANIISQLLQ